jgi:quinol-cytochrome oxidoreductase complex cytochrome b subunit
MAEFFFMGFYLRGRQANLKVGILTLGHVISQRFFAFYLHALQRHVKAHDFRALVSLLAKPLVTSV